MAKLVVDEQDKISIETLVGSLINSLYEQQRCGIDTVSTKIEIGALEEVKNRIHELGD